MLTFCRRCSSRHEEDGDVGKAVVGFYNKAHGALPMEAKPQPENDHLLSGAATEDRPRLFIAVN
jgi:hypothetical protein